MAKSYQEYRDDLQKWKKQINLIALNHLLTKAGMNDTPWTKRRGILK